MASETEIDTATRDVRLGEVFSPAAPIDKLKLFAGRTQQRSEIVDAILQRGRHAVLYGERGVGKTSLASTLREFIESIGKTILAPRINCDTTDTFSSVWRKVFAELRYVHEQRQIGFSPEIQKEVKSLEQSLPEGDVTPDAVRRLLAAFGEYTVLVVIIDEFDRLNKEASFLFSDTIKSLSDNSVPATILLMGVADTIETLIKEHESVERALAQVRLPRMSLKELSEIVDLGLNAVGMQIEPGARARIIALSQGLPHYTHLVTLYAARNANNSSRSNVLISDVELGIREAVRNAQQSIIATHHRAVMSARAESLFRHAALACALAKTDDLGYFTARDVREPMSSIMGRRFEIPAFARHMNEFCESKRGPILSRIGTSRNYRFRFLNPLLQPFIIMDGISKGLLKDELLAQFSGLPVQESHFNKNG